VTPKKRTDSQARRDATRSDGRGRAIAIAGLAFAAVTPATYGLLRALERWREPLIDPGQILTSTHMAFVWRSLVSGWFGVGCAGLVFLATRAGGEYRLLVRRLALAVAIVGGALALFSLRFP